MLLSASSITNLANIITGNSGISPEHTFEEIVQILHKYVSCESLEAFKESLELNGMERYGLKMVIFKVLLLQMNYIAIMDLSAVGKLLLTI